MNRRECVLGSAAVAATLASRPASARDAPTLASFISELPGFRTEEVQTARHRTSYIESGPRGGPLMIFLHGFPELGIVWTAQMAHFGARGWRCVAPDMRGYGGSSAPAHTAAYAVRETVADMVELHDALGGAPAIWIGHDWGAPVAWAMAAHHPERCRGVVGLSVPYLPRGHILPQLVARVDRKLYPIDRYPVGQWDYWLYYRESFALARRDFETDTAKTIAAVYQAGAPDATSKPSVTATVRERGGLFGPLHKAPPTVRDPRVLTQPEFNLFVATFQRTGFRPAISWYLNDAANAEFAGEADDFGQLSLPVLFVAGEYDTVDDTGGNGLAEPMRANCSNLTEAKLASGHFLMLEQRAQVSDAIDHWLAAKVKDVPRRL